MRGAELRERREARGLSLAEVSEATGITVEHLQALEEDRPGDLPPGPYASAYERTLGKVLGLSTTPQAAPAETPERRSAPLWGHTTIVPQMVTPNPRRVNGHLDKRPDWSIFRRG